MELQTIEGATPLDPDEIEGLLLTHIQTQGELNQWEQNNILHAEFWIQRQKWNTLQILTSDSMRMLHAKMFSDTWGWAGKFRKSNKNIGVDWPMISTELKKLLDDLETQITHHSLSYSELAMKFHHRLVSIHPFPNGNGRHARLATDVLLGSLNEKNFSWGQKGSVSTLTASTKIRKKYIIALRCADKGDYSKLMDFVNS
ncbi:MAG: mobile mystery protein B [Gammaproteobacteria bacterium]